MRYLVSGSQMKQIDAYAIGQIGIPSMVLMERAAMAVLEVVEEKASFKDRIWVACGTGNNGADGIAAARMLFLKGYRVTILLCGNPDTGTDEYRQQLAIAKKLDILIAEFCDFIPGSCDMIIDAVFGVGLSREIEGEYAEALTMLQERHAKVVIAVDLPSGIHSDTGRVMGIALAANVTVTFGYEKLGTALYPGKEYSGQVIVRDIGFPKVDFRNMGTQAFTYEETDLSRLPQRPDYSNKGSYGKVLLVAGSKNMSGAAYLSALAAYRMGAGLVKILTVGDNRVILQQQLPEAIIETYEPEMVWSGGELFRQLVGAACDWASVIVLGPGLGVEPYVELLVEEVLGNAYVPILIDADGLNAIARKPSLTQYYTENIIITPHLGEMSRLTGLGMEQIQGNLIGVAGEYSRRYGITCVLKDAVTVAAGRENQIYVNNSGNSGMAKAGSGDVLTGVIAGLVAQGEECLDAAALGVYLHGRAGDRCKAELGEHGILARDIANQLCTVRNRSDRTILEAE